METVKITFSCELTISADSLEEASEKWLDLPLFSEEAKKCHADYVELVSVEDDSTGEDITCEWNRL